MMSQICPALVPDGAPIWSPEIVEARLAEAMRFAVATAGRVGPRGFANGWPDVLREFEDYIWYGDRRWEEEARERIKDIERRSERRFSAAEASRAEEALEWPVRRLSDDLTRDAVWVQTLCAATGRDLERLLRARRRRADALLVERSKESPDIIRIFEDDATDIAAKWVGRANAALAQPLSESIIMDARIRKARRKKGRARAATELTPDELQSLLIARNRRIEAGIRSRARAEMKAKQVVERVTVTRRADVMPGRVFSRNPAVKWAARGVEEIALSLAEQGVVVR